MNYNLCYIESLLLRNDKTLSVRASVCGKPYFVEVKTKVLCYIFLYSNIPLSLLSTHILYLVNILFFIVVVVVVVNVSFMLISPLF